MFCVGKSRYAAGKKHRNGHFAIISVMKLLFLELMLICLVAVKAVAEERTLPERYRTIIDRQMFGSLPPDFDPEKMPSEVSRSSKREKELTREEEKLQSSVHFSVINVAADGTPVVGFTDISNPKAPVHHYIKAGEERSGWKVLSADMSEKTMTVKKDGVELTLKLGDNSGKHTQGSGAADAEQAVAATRQGRRSALLGGRGGLMTLKERRAQREKLMQERQEAEKKEREEEKAQREAEKAQLRQEREEQRQQLLEIQEELKRQRYEKQAEKQTTEQSEG